MRICRIGKIKLLKEFWGHRPGTVGWLLSEESGRNYIKLPGSPRATVGPTDPGNLWMEYFGRRAR